MTALLGALWWGEQGNTGESPAEASAGVPLLCPQKRGSSAGADPRVGRWSFKARRRAKHSLRELLFVHGIPSSAAAVTDAGTPLKVHPSRGGEGAWRSPRGRISRPLTKRPLRADAQRNYDAIVQAALDVFVEQGTQGSLDEIATRAGVANATLYRRFPTREDLLVAALRHRLADLDEIAARLSASDDPRAALEDWFFHVATHLRTWQGLPDSVARALGDDGAPLSHACQPLLVWSERLLARSTQTSGTRTDLDPIDVFTLVSSLAWAADTRGDSEQDLRRMIHLVLEGLCVKAPQSQSSTPRIIEIALGRTAIKVALQR